MFDDFNRRAGYRTTPLLRCYRRLVCDLLLGMLPALATHLVGVPAVITHHLKALIGNVLRNGDEYLAR